MIDPAADLDAIAKHSAEEDGYVRRAVSAHAWFRERIEQHVGKGDAYQNELLKKLFEALRYGLAVVSIELEGSDDPQTIFETLNSRGVDLTPGDLMRNFIFQRAKGMGQDEASLVVDKLYENYWLPLDGAFWQHLATRGRQSANRMDWMLTDHLSMKLADIVSKENLFDLYRRWILDAKPFASIEAELEAISKSASVERRIFERDKNDSIGRFGLFAEAFDVTTVFPLVVYLATEGNDDDQLDAALAMLESFILRRDICGLPNKNYNKFFVSTVAHLRAAAGSKVDALHTWLASRASDLDRWPDDEEWRRGWLGRDQYKSARQPRLRYLFEHIEQRKRTSLNEDIEIKSALTIEHIMPQQWRIHWPVPGFDHLDEDEIDAEQMTAEMHRSGCINKLGNLTLITQPLNSSVSHGPFSVKMPALRAYSSLALNRELEEFEQWDETSVARRGNTLFDVAGKVWLPPSSGL